MKAMPMLFVVCIVLLMSMLTGCGTPGAIENAPETLTEAEPTPEADGNEVSFARYACENSEAAVYVQLDINPSFVLGLTDNGLVVSIEAKNEDANDVMLNGLDNYFDEVVNGVELEFVIQDLAAAVQGCGYIEDSFDVEVTVLSGDIDTGTLKNACELAAADLSENNEIAASFDFISTEDEDSSENVQGDEDPSNEDSQGDESLTNEESNVCDFCSGDCTIVCELCNGTGHFTEIVEREVEVRNGYVCPYCGGVGILDDGMHGGETAVCGFCGGDGATGSMSGDFRALAFDTEIVQEEVESVCSQCGGSGIMDCPHCEGTGVIR